MQGTSTRARVALAASAVVLLALPASASGAATFSPTRFDDPAPGACTLSDCSLREAIMAANAASDVDTILLGTGSYENSAANGQLMITQPVTIAGDGARRTKIDGGGPAVGARVMQVSPPSGTVTIRDLTIRGGEPPAGNGGGGIYADNGTLELLRVRMTDNKVTGGGGFGGAIEGFGGATSINVRDSLIDRNDAENGGGGIATAFAPVVLRNVTMTLNSTPGAGGALNIGSGGLTIASSTIAFNSGNTDAVSVSGPGGVSFNTTLTIRNSILAKNETGDPTGPDCSDAGSGVVTSQGYNLVGDGTGCSFGAAPGDQIGTGGSPISPRLDVDDDYGGPTDTLKPLANSTAINRGAPGPSGAGACEASDQRGVPRSLGSRCDVGAYELVNCAGAAVNRVGTEGNDRLVGTGAAEVFLLLGGNDRVRAGVGGDRACGGAGRDKLLGEAGRDRLLGQAGRDRLKGGSGRDRLIGGPGRDLLAGGTRLDVCRGGPGRDRLISC